MKVFTTTGLCIPDENYMVNLDSRVAEIKKMVDAGEYFTINRARQYGKTTTLFALGKALQNQYCVLSLDFQGIGDASFQTEEKFVKAFCRQLRKKAVKAGMPDDILEKTKEMIDRKEDQAVLDELFDLLSEWCSLSKKPVVMFIDEVDSATNNQVFLDFLAQLRLQYLEKKADPEYKAFQSVILAGVTDVKNLKRKIRPEETHKFNSPWNIASAFNIDMSLSVYGISGMLEEYEDDHHTGMDTDLIAREIYNYTNGYPFLVSRICQVIDTELVGERFPDLSAAWTLEGISEAVRRILLEKNTLFDSLMGKVYENSTLRELLQRMLFGGERISYNSYDIAFMDGEMYGFLKNQDGSLTISNRIFEVLLYNYFLGLNESKNSPVSTAGSNAREEFIKDGRLNMEKLLSYYAAVFDDIYENQAEEFNEEEGRRRFLLFIRPVINGTGNYYIETQTRDSKRMDLVVDYLGERHVVELKIWRGKVYHEKGEKQLAEYLEHCHLDKGYLLTYSFIKSKRPGITKKTVYGKMLIEVIV